MSVPNLTFRGRTYYRDTTSPTAIPPLNTGIEKSIYGAFASQEWSTILDTIGALPPRYLSPTRQVDWWMTNIIHPGLDALERETSYDDELELFLDLCWLDLTRLVKKPNIREISRERLNGEIKTIDYIIESIEFLFVDWEAGLIASGIPGDELSIEFHPEADMEEINQQQQTWEEAMSILNSLAPPDQEAS